MPENYKAVNVLGQYRLFFKIFNAEQVVYFVWINNEDSIHAYENPDDCYRVFRDMVETGEIPPYVEPSIPKFILNPPDWSAPYVYAKLTQNIPAQQASADEHGIGLYHELNLQLDDLAKSRKILSKNGFTLDQQIDDVEIWVRPFKIAKPVVR